MIVQIALRNRIVKKLDGGVSADARLLRLVALKSLPEELFKELQARARFQRETQAASALNRPDRNPGRRGVAWV
jgi:hypothetical protein